MASLFAALFILSALFGSHTHAFLSNIYSRGHNRPITLSTAKHPFILSGETLLSFNNDHLTPAAYALIEAGNAWTVDWEEVTFACADAADIFRNVDGYEKVAAALQDLSQIGGCTSVGPPSSVPNLLELQSHFNKMAIDTGYGEFESIADAFGELAEEYS